MNVLASYAAARPGTSDELVVQHAPLVKRIAGHLLQRLPASVQSDDLIQAGLIGLLEASRNYDPSQGASFETYAGIRIRGAMLDEIRRNNWAPRSVFRKARRIAEAIRSLETTKGRDAHDHEVAQALGVSLDEYHQMLQESSAHSLFSFEELGDGDMPVEHAPNPFESVESGDFKRQLADAVGSLPDREKLVLSLFVRSALFSA
jgi:RNA polymerase sigma factor for flagellar operon FliA